MAKTKRQIIEELRLIDIVVELVDARIPIASRNPDIGEITKNKKRVIALNKSDLADENESKKWVDYFKKTRCFCCYYRFKYWKRCTKRYKRNRKLNE